MSTGLGVILLIGFLYVVITDYELLKLHKDLLAQGRERNQLLRQSNDQRVTAHEWRKNKLPSPTSVSISPLSVTDFEKLNQQLDGFSSGKANGRNT